MENEDFQKFWSVYPRKVAKGQARKAFVQALKLVSLEDMLSAIEAQKLNRRHLAKNNIFVPEWKHPATWLRGECWDDELRAVYVRTDEKLPSL